MTLFLSASAISAQEVGKSSESPVTIVQDEILRDLKKERPIFIPKVQGKDPELVKKVSQLVTFEAVFTRNWEKGRKLVDEVSEFPKNFYAYYDVLMNRNNILSLGWHTSFVGAGLTLNHNYTVISLASGKRLRADDVFICASLLKMLRKDGLKAIAEKEAELKREGYTGEYPPWRASVRAMLLTRKALDDFYVQDDGIGFPIDRFTGPDATLTPSWKNIYKWAELKAYIKNPGPLAAFIK